MHVLEQLVFDQLTQLLADSKPPIRRLFLALSGGKDSSALLHALVAVFDSDHFTDFISSHNLSVPDLSAIHVHHGLQDEADQWQAFCQSRCDDLSLNCISIRANIQQSNNLEAAAREARYAAFAKILVDGDALLLAHHQRDQAETFLYRSLRGAGAKGLAAMRKLSSINLGEGRFARLFRPLLDLDYSAISDYVSLYDIPYVHDSSNDEVSYDRNYLRNNILPVIEQRWPQAQLRLAVNAEHLREADDLLEQLAEIDLQKASSHNGEPLLRLNYFLSLSDQSKYREMRFKNALRVWLSSFDVSISEAQLNDLSYQFFQEEKEIDVELLSRKSAGQRYNIRSYQQALYLLDKSKYKPQKVQQSYLWDIASHFCWGDVFYECQVQFDSDIDKLLVKHRQEGESIIFRGKRRKVKKLLQELHIAPWRRDDIPYFYWQGELVAIADLVLCDEFFQQGVRVKLLRN